MKVGSKWKCKVNICTIACSTKWLLTMHLKKVHALVAKKTKLGKSFEKGPQYQDHVKMNVRILGNAMDVQRQNDQKVISCARAKA